MHLSKTVSILSCLALSLALQNTTHGHGFAGNRFFPATLTTDDPFVADEMSLPTISTTVDSDGTRETDLSFAIAKKITPNFGIEIGETFSKFATPGERTVNGQQNLELGAKYQFYINDEHETILSLGLDTEIGGTGRKLIDADRFTTWSPAIFFGKGLGDLPNSLSLLRPLAITGLVGIDIPSSWQSVTISHEEGERSVDIEQHPASLNWGFAIEYSLPYLQSQVKDIGLKKPFNQLIPLVEFSFQDPVNRGESGQVTGTINPGVIWSGKYCQIGAEAIIPINSRSGSEVGMIVQVHFYLDDVLPKAFGHPLFGGQK